MKAYIGRRQCCLPLNLSDEGPFSAGMEGMEEGIEEMIWKGMEQEGNGMEWNEETKWAAVRHTAHFQARPSTSSSPALTRYRTFPGLSAQHSPPE